MSGWVKLHRSFLEFDWYDDPNVVRVLLHLILTCNYEAKQWRGIDIQAGQIVTSYDKLAEALSLSPKQIRLALDKLEKGREIERNRAGKGQLVTLVKWAKFQQDDNQEGRKRAGKKEDKGQEEGRKRATTKEGKEIEENKEGEEVTHAQKLIQWLQTNCPDVCKMKEPLTNEQAQSIIDKYPNPNFVAKTFQAMDNYKPLKQKNKSAYKTFLNWASRDFESYKEANGHQPQKKRI
jgi:hypothetical protein